MPEIVDECVEPFENFLEAALYWFMFGLNVIPILPGTKKTAVNWDPWLKDLSPEKITDYWSSPCLTFA